MEAVKNVRLQELDQTDNSQKRYEITLSNDSSDVKGEFKLNQDHITELYREGTTNVTVFGNDIKRKSPFKIGRVYSLIYVNDEPMIIIGPQYYMSFFLSIVILSMSTIFIYFLFEYLSIFLRLLAYSIFLFEFISQAYCTLINPGIPHRNNYISERIIHLISQGLQADANYLNKYRICKKCNIIVPAEQPITHCDICNICCEGIYYVYAQFRYGSSLRMDRKMHWKK